MPDLIPDAELIAEARKWPSDMGEGATLNAFADALEAAEQQLAAAQAVIAEALRQTRRGNLMTPPWVIEALSQSPADALQAAKAAAWDEGARHVYAEVGKCPFARDGDPCPYNPYRRDKTDE